MKRAVGLHPVSVLVALLLGANFFGFIGLILAIPATVVLGEFIEELERRKPRGQTLM
jgi:predicted PurR-regulated permease PerM